MRGINSASSISSTRSDKLFVENYDILEDIIADSNANTSNNNKYSQRKSSSRNNSYRKTDRILSSVELNSKLLREQMEIKLQQDDAQMKRQLKEALMKRSEDRDTRFKNLMSSIESSKDTLKSIDKNLDLHFETKRNKVRRQFEEWNSNVHGKIQMNIAKQINEIDSKSLNKLKNEDYNKFLDISNRKACIFRDIIIESEYDPLEPNRRAIKAKTIKLKDPTLIDQQKSEMESSMLNPNPNPNDNNNNNKQKQLLGKETLAVELWAAGKIEGTPYGSFAKLMSPGLSQAPGQDRPRLSATSQSNVVFNHFEFPCGKDAVDAEMPRGKRVFPTKTYADPRKIYDELSNAEMASMFT